MVLEKEKVANLNVYANNDPSKEQFGGFTETFIQGKFIGSNEKKNREKI